MTLRHLAESASVVQGSLAASVINLSKYRQVRNHLATPYLMHLREPLKVFKVFKVVKAVKAVKVVKVVKIPSRCLIYSKYKES